MERRNFANIAVELMSEIANPHEEWALKSQTAALVAEVFLVLRSFSSFHWEIFAVTYVWAADALLQFCDAQFNLLLQIVRREGLNLWEELLPSLVSLSNNGPMQVKLYIFVYATLLSLMVMYLVIKLILLFCLG